MSDVLITGAAGFLGRHLAAELSRRDRVALGVGRSPVAPATLPCSYRRLDLLEAAAVEDLVAEARPKLVIHLAAALRDESWPDLLAGNVTAVSNLVQAMGRGPVGARLILVSSGSVYGNQPVFPTSEDARPAPVGLYASSKLMGELAGQALGASFALTVTVARVFNLLGPGLQVRHLAARLCHDIARIEAGLAEPRVVTGSLGATRDFLDVRDAARMLADLASAPNAPPVVNIGSGRETQVRRLASDLVKRARRPVELVEAPARAAPAGADRQAADTQRARALGLAAAIPLDVSLSDMLHDAREGVGLGSSQAAPAP